MKSLSLPTFISVATATWITAMMIVVFGIQEIFANSASPIRTHGVPPQFIGIYRNAGATSVFNCFNGQEHISKDGVNDGICQCSDCSDEPGTGASERIPFICEKDGRLIALSKAQLQDTKTCYCSDCSDKWKSRQTASKISLEDIRKISDDRQEAISFQKQWITEHFPRIADGTSPSLALADQLKNYTTLPFANRTFLLEGLNLILDPQNGAYILSKHEQTFTSGPMTSIPKESLFDQPDIIEQICRPADSAPLLEEVYQSIVSEQFVYPYLSNLEYWCTNNTQHKTPFDKITVMLSCSKDFFDPVWWFQMSGNIVVLVNSQFACNGNLQYGSSAFEAQGPEAMKVWNTRVHQIVREALRNDGQHQ